MKFLVTGGLGFVGSRFIELARAEFDGAEFIIFDNFSVGKLSNLSSFINAPNHDGIKLNAKVAISNDVSVIKGDIRNVQDIEQIEGGIDVIIHLAGNTGVQPSIDDPLLDLHANVIGTFNILNFAKAQSKPPRVIFSSSNAPLGEAKQPVNEESTVAPLSPYGASKLAAEGYLSAYHASFGVPTIALRFGNLYGVGSTHKSSVVAKFIKHALNGEDLPIYGDGSQSRDFLYLDDLVKAIMRASVADGVFGEIFQISTGRETTVLELVEKLSVVLKKQDVTIPKLEFTPKRIGDMAKNYSDISKAKRMLSWEPIETLQTGLEKTVNWFLTS